MSCEMKMAVLDEATNIQIFFLITFALTTSRTLKVMRNNDKRKKVGEIRSEIKNNSFNKDKALNKATGEQRSRAEETALTRP